MVVTYSYFLAALIAGLSVLGLSNTSSPPTKNPVANGLTAANSHRALALPAISKEQCADCHEDEVASFDNTSHARAWHSDQGTCDNCHDGAEQHLKSGGAKGTITSVRKLSAQEASETCLKCHEQTGEQSHMRMSEHMGASVSCIQCHDVHPDKETKMKRVGSGGNAMMRADQKELCTSCHKDVGAQFALPTHHRLQEGVVECSNCHNPHGSTEQKQLRADNKENCVKCHEDKRGPFTFEHDAQNLDGCLSCHSPHGASGPHLLKARDQRTLCISCHSKEGAAGVPHGRNAPGAKGNTNATSLQTSGDCTRCHSEIHGSHTDPFFTH